MDSGRSSSGDTNRDDIERKAQREVLRLWPILIKDSDCLRQLERCNAGVDDALGPEWAAADKARHLRGTRSVEPK